jgi:hypothetical protein
MRKANAHRILTGSAYGKLALARPRRKTGEYNIKLRESLHGAEPFLRSCQCLSASMKPKAHTPSSRARGTSYVLLFMRLDEAESLDTAAANVSVPDVRRRECRIGGMLIGRRKPCLSATVHHKSHMDCPWSEPDTSR